jgi:membrane protein DedA with SNARE-associated domain
MTPFALTLIAGFAWGVIVGGVLMYWTGARYARDLHDRVTKLECQPREFDPNQATLDRIEKHVMARVNFELSADEDEDDAVIH